MSAPIVVAKYGGSSLATPEHIRSVADTLAAEQSDGAQRVVVVSAMGDSTDDLLALAGAVTKGIPDARELDLLLATGEQISAALLVMALHERGIEAVSLTGPQAGIQTDGMHGRARITGIEPERIQRELDAGRVAVVAGFQGSSGVEVATLGRGGSDTSAVALAVAMGAVRCEIFTDVDGVYTADPRLVPEARPLPEIGFEEMLELAHLGAKVLQTRSVELAWVYGLEVDVRKTGSSGPGTRIKEVAQMETRQKVRGIATDDGMAKVTLLDLGDRPGMAASVFAPLAEAGIPVDGIVQNIGHDGAADLSFIVPESDMAPRRGAAATDAARAWRARPVRFWRPGQDQHRRRRHPLCARLPGPDVRRARRRRRQHRDDHDLRHPDHLRHRQQPPAAGGGGSSSGVPAGAAGMTFDERPSVAVVGATGLVGRTMLQVLSERGFPAREIRALASARSAGSDLNAGGRSFTVAEATPEAFDGVDIALFSAGAEQSRVLAPRCGRTGRRRNRQLVRMADG